MIRRLSSQSWYGNLSVTDLVANLYLNVLHRPGETAGLKNWITQLQTGLTTRRDVVLGFADSLESRVLTAPKTHANRVVTI